jgi:hypothetical protein
MSPRLVAAVRRRARYRCEYCQFPQRLAELPFQIDHVIAQQHHGATASHNLALACYRCNSHKGPNLSGVDPESGEIVVLFNPRKNEWRKHFVWRGPKLIGLSPTGRATIDVLCINRSDAVLARAALLEEGISLTPYGRR